MDRYEPAPVVCKHGQAAPPLYALLQTRLLQTMLLGVPLPPEKELLTSLCTRLQASHPRQLMLLSDAPADILSFFITPLPNTGPTAFDTLDTLKAHLETAVLKSTFETGLPLSGKDATAVTASVLTLIEAELLECVRAWYVGKPSPPPVLLQAMSVLDYYLNVDYRIARACLKLHPAQATFKAALSTGEKSELTRMLMTMPVVKAALNGTLAGDPTWGGKRTPPKTWVEVLDIQSDESSADAEDDRSGLLVSSDRKETTGRVKIACTVIANLVDPLVLGNLCSPTFYVIRHKRADKEAKNARAYAEAGRVGIHIDEGDDVPTIVHEIGHVIENLLPLGCWLDLQRLLRARHAAQPPDALIQIYPGSKDADERAECAYKAVMPATGVYSAKCYTYMGGTELMSMALQFLCQPKTAQSLIEQDPQLALIILRWLTPSQVASAVHEGLALVALPSPRY